MKNNNDFKEKINILTKTQNDFNIQYSFVCTIYITQLVEIFSI